MCVYTDIYYLGDTEPCHGICAPESSKPNILLDKYGKPVRGPDDNYILLGPDGIPRNSENRPYVLDEDGQLIYDLDDKPIIVGVKGKPVTSDGKPILLDVYGQPVLGLDGLPSILPGPHKCKTQKILKLNY